MVFYISPVEINVLKFKPHILQQIAGRPCKLLKQYILFSKLRRCKLGQVISNDHSDVSSNSRISCLGRYEVVRIDGGVVAKGALLAL